MPKVDVYDNARRKGRIWTIEERESVRRNCEIWEMDVTKIDCNKEMDELIGEENFVLAYLRESYYYHNQIDMFGTKHKKQMDKTHKIRNV